MSTALTPAEAQAVHEQQMLIQAEMQALSGALAQMTRQLTWHGFTSAFEHARKAYLAAQKMAIPCGEIVALLTAKMSQNPAHLVEPGPLGETSKEDL